ncbi:hypothetical protein DFQ14_11378 [Halopolyspora algeriensis]|uniref:Uncharacterized protein n=1 Tax=Halopolyspora algeriensis TaxID=1500506 RepID=A0A368VFY1_9ACTN|nr:hypothetical protein DFQ14_11378 [Halopolyspora algeriensis]TQM46566.1 hypothetical protein FHU43_3683 [Halopolyspora algeriensis]
MLAPAGIACTERNDESIHVLPRTVPPALFGEFTGDRRDGDVR